MKCPHCQSEFFAVWKTTVVDHHQQSIVISGKFHGRAIYPRVRATKCPACAGAILELQMESTTEDTVYFTVQIYPRGGKFPAAPIEVPAEISADYAEANEVLPISAKASAALSRRCLQAILSAHGYSARNLVQQVEEAIGEQDAAKALPTAIRDNIDAIRNFGNFSAHPITDQTTLQIVDVQEGEAEWCLEILNDLFDHYYVGPARAAARRAALSKKLGAAGKPPMK